MRVLIRLTAPCVALSEAHAGINIGAIRLDRAIKAHKSEANLTYAGYVICGSLDINCDEPEGSIFRWCELKRAWHFGERIVRHAKDCYAFYRRTQYI